MKIQCDVCDKDEASVFCVADEAALCATCDNRVHHANKLAGKHQRFSLPQPSSSKHQLPLCDICKERRAFLFCQQDRAILCRDCDVPIHKANEHKQKHTRYLLTGVKLSATATVYSDASCSAESESSNLANNSSNASDSVSNVVKNQKGAPSAAKGASGQSTVVATVSGSCQKSSSTSNVEVMDIGGGGDLSNNGDGSVSTRSSTISEYLIEMLPGWHVEDFLDSSLSTYGFLKNGENDVLPLWDGDLETNMGAFSTEKMGCWVPQVLPTLHQTTQNQSTEMVFGSSQNGLIRDQQQPKQGAAAANNDSIKSNRKWSDLDNSFAVPQISSPPSSNSSKRSRTFW